MRCGTSTGKAEGRVVVKWVRGIFGGGARLRLFVPSFPRKAEELRNKFDGSFFLVQLALSIVSRFSG